MLALRLRATTVPILLLAATTLAAGCAKHGIAWEKAGVSPADRERDENACLRAAISLDRGALLEPYSIDRDVYVRCMEGRGYTVRPR
jgi:hypothetical protein